MNRSSAILVRIAATAIALLFGLALGVLQFIDSVSHSTTEVALSVGKFMLLGVALQAGLFWAPNAIRRGRRAITLCALLMLPMPLLVAWQFQGAASDLLRYGYGEFGSHLQSDPFLYAIFIGLLLLYAWVFVVLARAVAHNVRRSDASAA